MDVLTEYKIFLKNGGVFERPSGFVQVRGPDAADFLHRLTSQDVKSLKPGQGRPGALLQANSMIIALFTIYYGNEAFLLVTDQEVAAHAAEHLEKLHFAENLEISNLTGGMGALSVQGPDAALHLKEVLGLLPLEEHAIVRGEHGGQEVLIAKENDFKPGGFHLFARKEQLPALKMKLLTEDLVLMSQELWQLMRVEAGHFAFGKDVGEKNLILEAPVDDHLSRDKGCYPGQEVVERVFTYGNVAKKLVGLSIEGEALASGTKVFAEGKEVGAITSTYFLPWSEKTLAFAMVRKPYYRPGQTLRVEGQKTAAEVLLLPQSFEIAEKLSKT